MSKNVRHSQLVDSHEASLPQTKSEFIALRLGVDLTLIDGSQRFTSESANSLTQLIEAN